MPKPVNKLAVLKPALEQITAARVRIMKSHKHIDKLSDEELSMGWAHAYRLTCALEKDLKKRLERERKEVNRNGTYKNQGS